jgi:hypothetical protein
MVGDGHTMSVAAEIVQHIFGSTEGTFQVDHPVLSMKWPQPGGLEPPTSPLSVLRSLVPRLAVIPVT